MSVADILLVGSAIVAIASKIQDLAQSDWYIVSEDYRSKVADLRTRLDTLGKQLHIHGLPLDGNMVKTLQKAKLLLEKEEAKQEEVRRGGCFAHVQRLMVKLDQVIFPRKLERTLQNVVDEIEKIPKNLQMEIELADVLREHRDSQPMSTIKDNTLDDDFYVPIEASHSAVFNALNDSNGPPVTLLHGGPGKGKSTLARYVHVHYHKDQREMENKFEHVVWLPCGPKADILAKQNELLQILDPKSSKESLSLEELQAQGGLNGKIRRSLQGLLHSQKILIILDDVWEENFIPEMWEVSGESVRYLVTSQKANLCWSWPKEVLSIAMEKPTKMEARKILASHVGLEGKEIPLGNIQMIADKLVNKTDSNPLALASFANYFAYSKNRNELLEEKEWSDAYNNLSSLLASNKRRFVLGQSKGLESLWVTMGRSIEQLETGPGARELLALTYMCEGPDVPEEVLKTLFEKTNNVEKDCSGSFSLARKELDMRKLLITRSDLKKQSGKSWALHSLVQLYFQEKMSEEIKSAINSIIIVTPEIDPNRSEMEEAEIEKAVVVTALCALYFDHCHHDAIVRDFTNKAALELKIPFGDLTELKLRRKAIEPVVRLLGEIDNMTGPLDKAEQKEKGQQAIRYSQQVFLKYVCEQQLDFSSISALLTMVNFPSIVLAILGALQDIFRTEKTPLLSANIQGVAHDLSCFLKKDVEANIQECALGTLMTFLWRAKVQENLTFPLSSMLGVLEGLVRVVQDLTFKEQKRKEKDRTMISKEYALAAMGNLTYKLNDQEKLTILEYEGALEGIVKSLCDDRDTRLQEIAVGALRNLAGAKHNRIILHFKGALVGLVRSLHKDDNPPLQENAATALRNLALGPDEAKMKILHHERALAGLVRSLHKHDNPPLQVNAAGALTNLTRGPEEAKMKILHQEGALVGLVRSLHKDDNPALQEKAAGALSNLALGSDEAKMEILHHEGALVGLVSSLHKLNNYPLQVNAAAALNNLARGPEEAKMKILHQEGALASLVRSLYKDNNPALQEKVVGALNNLALGSDQAKLEILHHEGALACLVLSLHKDENPPLGKNVVRALHNLALGTNEAKMIMKEAIGLSQGLLGLLAKHVAANTQRWAATAITLIDPTLGKKASLVVGEAYLGRAEASAIMGMYEDALHDLDQANLLRPWNAETLSSRCFVKVKLGDLNGALADANKAIEVGDDKVVGLQERGVLKQIMGDLDGALGDLNQALKLVEDDYECLKHRGYVRFLVNDEEGARDDAERAMTVKQALVDDPSYEKFLVLGTSSVEYLGYKLT